MASTLYHIHYDSRSSYSFMPFLFCIAQNEVRKDEKRQREKKRFLIIIRFIVLSLTRPTQKKNLFADTSIQHSFDHGYGINFYHHLE